VGHKETGRNILDLYNLKIEIEPLTLEKTITSKGGYTSRGEVGGNAKTDLCIICIMREIRIIGQEIAQFSQNPKKR
jgi:hypothetical protein